MLSINVNRKSAAEKLAESLPNLKEVVYMCIGCDKVLADSLGPRVGMLLQQNMKSPVFVYGLANSNINAVNLIKAHELIKTLHANRKIVVIDAAVGEESQLGTITFSPTPLRPGSATNKNLPFVGDYSIMGIVACNGLNDFYSTAYDRQLLIEEMANVISKAILLRADTKQKA